MVAEGLAVHVGALLEHPQQFALARRRRRRKAIGRRIAMPSEDRRIEARRRRAQQLRRVGGGRGAGVGHDEPQNFADRWRIGRAEGELDPLQGGGRHGGRRRCRPDRAARPRDGVGAGGAELVVDGALHGDRRQRAGDGLEEHVQLVDRVGRARHVAQRHRIPRGYVDIGRVERHRRARALRYPVRAGEAELRRVIVAGSHQVVSTQMSLTVGLDGAVDVTVIRTVPFTRSARSVTRLVTSDCGWLCVDGAKVVGMLVKLE